MHLYKYLPEKFALQMINEETIRISTLYEFRTYEDKERGDDNEGKITIETIGPEEAVEYTEQEQIPGNFRKFIQLSPGSKLVLSGKSKSTIPYNCPDVYIYCCSTSYSSKLMAELNSDCCIEIHDLHKFLHVVSSALFQKRLGYGIGFGQDCIYKGHLHYHEEGQSPHWLKDSRYDHQKEYRFIFPALIIQNGNVIPLIKNGSGFNYPKEGLHQQPLEPVILRCEGIRSCIRLIDK